MVISKIHAQYYDAVRISKDLLKAPAKTKNYIFSLINVMFSEDVSAKFIILGVKNDKDVFVSGLAGFEDFLARVSSEIST